MFSVGRAVVVVYVIAVFVIGFSALDPAPKSVHFYARRYLAPNTLIDASLLRRPRADWIFDDLRLDRELQAVSGQYLKDAALPGDPVVGELTTPWPNGVVPGSIATEQSSAPDPSIINAGSTVRVGWHGQDATAIPATANVLAVIATAIKTRWLVLLKWNGPGDTPKDLHDLTLGFVAFPEASSSAPAAASGSSTTTQTGSAPQSSGRSITNSKPSSAP
jgi:hypothetical protein